MLLEPHLAALLGKGHSERIPRDRGQSRERPQLENGCQATGSGAFLQLSSTGSQKAKD